jgi:hypothetical protein
MWLAGLAVSLGIFAVLYFTVIRPDTNTANQAIKTGLQQSQQELDQAQKQVSSASGQASAAASHAVSEAARCAEADRVSRGSRYRSYEAPGVQDPIREVIPLMLA